MHVAATHRDPIETDALSFLSVSDLVSYASGKQKRRKTRREDDEQRTDSERKNPTPSLKHTEPRVSSLKKKKNLFLKMEVDGDGELLLASEDGKDMGLPQLAFSVSAEKSNDLRKKLEARKALTAATGHQGVQSDGGRSRKRESGGGRMDMQQNGYAKLEGPKVSRVMQSVCLTLGRDSTASKRKTQDAADDDEDAQQREKR